MTVASNLQILVDGKDVTPWYKSKSLRGTKTAGGERDAFGFTLEIPHSDSEGMAAFPFPTTVLQKFGRNTELDVKVKGGTGIGWPTPRMLFRGRTRMPAGQTIGKDATNYGTRYDVQCTSYEKDLARIPVMEIYKNKASGWIVLDLAQRFCEGVDVSGIVYASPPCKIIPILDTKHMTPVQLFDLLAAVQGWEWFLDGNNILYFKPPTENYAPFHLTDDSNLYESGRDGWASIDEIASLTPTVEPDSTNIVNVVKLFYKTFEERGTAQISIDDKVIVGTGTNWLTTVRPGARFNIVGESFSSQVDVVLSDTRLEMSGKYTTSYNRRDSAGNLILTGLPYRISNIPYAQLVQDPVSIDALKSIRGDNGINEQVITSSNNYSFDQARMLAQARLDAQSNPMVNIKFDTDSYRAQDEALPGQTMKFDLSKRFYLKESLPIRSLTISDMGFDRGDNFPMLSYTFNFETRLYSFSRLIRSIEENAQLLAQPEDVDELSDIVWGSDMFQFKETAKVLLENWGPFRWGPPDTRTFAEWASGTLGSVEEPTRVIAGKLEIGTVAGGFEFLKATNEAGTLWPDNLVSFVNPVAGDYALSLNVGEQSTSTVAGNGFNNPFKAPRWLAFKAPDIYASDETLGGVLKVTTGGGVTNSSFLMSPRGIAFDAAGDLFIAESGNIVIRKMTPDGNITTWAGLEMAQAGGNGYVDGPRQGDVNVIARFNTGMSAICFDSAENLYIAEAQSSRIRRLVKATDQVETFYQGSNFAITDMVCDTSSNTLYISTAYAVYRYRIGTDIAPLLFIGAEVGGLVNGSFAAARFGFITRLSLDQARQRLYLAEDSFNYGIRLANIATATVSQLTGGVPMFPYYLEDFVSTARWNGVSAITIDSANEIVYAVDEGAYRLRRVPLKWTYQWDWDGALTSSSVGWPGGATKTATSAHGALTFKADASPPAGLTLGFHIDGVTILQNTIAAKGYWISPVLPLKSTPKDRTFSAVVALAGAGSAASYSFRTVGDFAATKASVWSTNDADPSAALQAVPLDIDDLAAGRKYPAKYLQVRVSLTKGATGSPKVTSFAYTPENAYLKWGQGYWGPDPTFAGGGTGTSLLTLGTIVNLEEFVTAGAKRLRIPSTGGSLGTWTSKWQLCSSPIVNKVATIVLGTVPANTSVAFSYRSSYDGTDLSSSGWYTDITQVPEHSYLQIRALFSKGSEPASAELESILIDPL